MNRSRVRVPVSALCGNSSVGRALASQAGGREFEPRLPLEKNENVMVSYHHTFSTFAIPTNTLLKMSPEVRTHGNRRVIHI